MARASLRTISCAWSRRELGTGTASRPRGGRGMECGLGDVGRHRDGDTPEQLDALGQRIDQLVLLFVMLVEQQVQLLEGGAGNLPVMFLYRSRSVIVSAIS